MRVGLGYDIHRLVPGRRLILGGVEIPSPLGLEGHSDADVVLHAVMDALLGACALGDIGSHFPPGDERFRDASSLDLLADVRELLRHAAFEIVNVDVVVVAERPRIGPHVEEMRGRMAAALGIGRGDVSVKATTNEGVGPEGRGEAINAQAIALVRRQA
jgi:2-C-methyl-D-erythritol 2,4-cyclodiphosphate synthase